MKVRAKIRIREANHTEYGIWMLAEPVPDDGIPENERFHKATPAGQIKLLTTNPVVSEYLKPGREFYVDLTEAPAPQT